MPMRALHRKTFKNRFVSIAGNLLRFCHAADGLLGWLRLTTPSVYGSVEGLCADIVRPLGQVP
jgi:hypothetical protein